MLKYKWYDAIQCYELIKGSPASSQLPTAVQYNQNMQFYTCDEELESYHQEAQDRIDNLDGHVSWARMFHNFVNTRKDTERRVKSNSIKFITGED